jgi:hypothetical protein
MQKVPRWLTLTAAAMAGWLWVSCGKGIYTYPRFRGDDAGPESKPSPDSRPANGRDAYPAEPQTVTPPDATTDLSSPPPDVGTPSATATIDWQGGEVVAGDGRLVIPKDVLASEDLITLTQVSADGTLPGYRGAVGPVFSISKTAVFQRPARFELKLAPDSSIPVSRLALAYIDPQARLWIILADSSYDSSAEVISAVVNEFSSPWTIAPVLRCNSPAECDSTTACQGGVCQ